MKAVFMCIGFVCTVVVAVAVYVWHNTQDVAEPDVSRFVNAVETPSDAENVLCGLVAATNAIKWTIGDVDYHDVMRRQNFELAPQQREAVFSANASAFKLIHEAAQRKAWCAPEWSMNSGIAAMPVSAFADIIHLDSLQAEYLLGHGDVDAVTEVVSDLLLLARKIEHDADNLVMWILANGAHGAATKIALKVVASGKATEEELSKLQHVLRQFEFATRKERLRRMLNNELFHFMHMQRLLKLKSPDNAEVEQLFSRRIGPFPFSYAYHPNRTRVMFIKSLDKAWELLRHDYDEAAWAAWNGFHDEEHQPGKKKDYGPNFIGRTVLLPMAPEWKGVAESLATSSFRHCAVEVVVAAQRFKYKTGAYPRMLAELVPAYLSSVPEDPFGHGAEMKYDVERGIVWTVGKEGNFNGDLANDKSDPNRRKNLKYVYRLDGSTSEN